MTTQRRVTIETPLGEALQFRQLKGREELSQLYEFELDLISKGNKDIDPKAVLGKHCTVVVETEGLGKRYLDGIAIHLGLQGQDTRSHFSYKLVLAPWLWLATRKTDFKIHQNMTVPQIIQEILAPFGYPLELKLTRAYRQRDYTVIYNETVYNFISRLCESEGIYWYYKHAPGQHTVVFCDDVVGSHEPLPGGASIPFHAPDKIALADKEHIFSWVMGQNVRQGSAYLDDYDFTKPRADLSQLRRNPPGHSHDDIENYIWPGNFKEHADGEVYARLHMQGGLSKHHRATAKLTKRAIAPGYTIELTNHPRASENQQYLVTWVDYHLEENVQSSDGGGGGARASIGAATLAPAGAAPSSARAEVETGSFQRFTMQAHAVSEPYRPLPRTRKPSTSGPQTAIVVGPPGEEIYCDQYGRVKVQFHWDRIGTLNENSSCWVRVSTSWAGPNFGAVFTPRIGMEVVIDFLNGDPDYPILTGCLYNADNMPPWTLPGNATQSGLLTRSSKGGAGGAGMGAGAGDANALRFEDKAGSEQLWLHAQKDQLTEVENDEDKWVGQDRRKNVDRDETNHIGRDRTETVDHDETITVHNNRTERVDHNETVSIGDNRTEDVGLNESVTVGKNQTFTVGDNRTKSVGKNEKDSIGKNWSITVGKFKTETIGMAYMQNVGLGRMENVGLGYNLNVGAGMMTNTGLARVDTVGVNWTQNTGAKHSHTVGDEYVLSVGASSLTLKADGTIVLKGVDIQVLGSGDVTAKAGGTLKHVGSNIQNN